MDQKRLGILAILFQHSVSANWYLSIPSFMIYFRFLTLVKKISFLVDLPRYLYLSYLALHRTCLLKLPFKYHLTWRHILYPIYKKSVWDINSKYILTLDSSVFQYAMLPNNSDLYSTYCEFSFSMLCQALRFCTSSLLHTILHVITLVWETLISYLVIAMETKLIFQLPNQSLLQFRHHTCLRDFLLI